MARARSKCFSTMDDVAYANAPSASSTKPCKRRHSDTNDPSIPFFSHRSRTDCNLVPEQNRVEKDYLKKRQLHNELVINIV